MRTLGAFLLLIAAALLLSALFNYPLYLMLDGQMESGPHKLVNTTAKLLAIPGFFLLIKRLGMYSRAELGYGIPCPAFLREMMRGWLAGVLILLILSGILVAFEVRTPRPIDGDLWSLLLKTALTGLIGGLLIGLIEETFFRGGIYRAICQNSSLPSAMILSSLLYASMHFISPEPLPGDTPYTWTSGLQILSGAFVQFKEWNTFDSFLALFLIGLFLNLLRERTGNIAYCIGIHAGWIFVIRLTKKLTSINETSNLQMLIGDYDGITGYLATLWIFLLTLLYYRYWRVKIPVTATDRRMG